MQDVARAGELQAATRQVLEESTRTVKEKLHTKARHRKQAQLHLRVRGISHARHVFALCCPHSPVPHGDSTACLERLQAAPGARSAAHCWAIPVLRIAGVFFEHWHVSAMSDQNPTCWKALT